LFRVESKTTKKSHKWHAVCVVLQTSSCAAAAMCRNSRFLAGEAPRFPLPGCANPDDCHCTYKHFEDRRTGSRRAVDAGLPSNGAKPSGEQRKSRGRREQDKR